MKDADLQRTPLQAVSIFVTYLRARKNFSRKPDDSLITLIKPKSDTTFVQKYINPLEPLGYDMRLVL